MDKFPERLRPSLAKRLIAECPAKVFLGKGKKKTEAMGAGTLVDALVFGTPEVVEIQEADWRKKEPKKVRDDLAKVGKIGALTHELDEARAMGRQVLRAVEVHGLPCERRHYQQTLTWEENGIPCQGTPDVIDVERRIIWDLKGTESCRPKDIRKTIESFGYHIQLAAYESAAEQLYGGAGHWQKYLLFVEWDAPHVTQLVSLSEAMLSLGSRQWLRAVEIFRNCRDSGVYPGYSDGCLEVDPTPWALNEEADL